MNSDVYKILYRSKNLIEGEDAKREAEITQILQTARRKNKEQNVTGALLFNSGYFAQALEGPRLAIEQIFERIQRDPRHGDVTALSSQPNGHIDFPEWSMAYVAPPGGGAPPVWLLVPSIPLCCIPQLQPAKYSVCCDRW